MSIPIRYTSWLLKKKLVNEVHIWNFIVSNAQDTEFLNKFIRDTPVEGYRLFIRPLGDKYIGWADQQGKVRGNGTSYLWFSFYEHYTRNGRYRDDDIIVKVRRD